MVDYKDFLKTKIFNVEKQKSFEIMFEMFDEISQYSEKSLILERSFIYSGKSIFSGLLKNECDIVDYLIDNNIYPIYLSIDFDIIHIDKERVYNSLDKLKKYYHLIHTNGQDYSFIIK